MAGSNGIVKEAVRVSTPEYRDTWERIFNYDVKCDNCETVFKKKDGICPMCKSTEFTKVE